MNVLSSKRRAYSSPSGVGPDVARSWLLVAASSYENFAAPSRAPCDQVIFDSEDGEDPRFKNGARRRAAAWLAGTVSGWVRINDRSSDFWAADIDGLRDVPGLRGVVLAKA